MIPILPLPSCIFSKVCHWLTCDGLQGVNKHNGETVAVKTFNQLSHMRPQEVQMREFEVSPGRATLQEYSLIIGLTRGHAPCSSGPDHELGVTGSGESQTREHRQAAGHRGGAGGAGQGEVIMLLLLISRANVRFQQLAPVIHMIINSIFPIVS